MHDLRCRAGDLARVRHSTNPGLIGRIVLVERRCSVDRWEVTVLGEAMFGLTLSDRRPIITNRFAFRDSSLIPLREDGCGLEIREQEASHG